MKDNMITNFDIKNSNNFTSSLKEIIRDEARKMLQSLIENEVIEIIENNCKANLNPLQKKVLNLQMKHAIL
ncbi:MAG: hypothetical protein JXA94_02135 [Parachlamydiales bacterium]|nr:hypothetical protein [Parachlamydiales bacterium]